MDPSQWSWGLRCLLECTAWRTRENIAQILAMAFYSRMALRELRAGTGIAYDESTRGILHYYTDRAELEAAREATAVMRRHGLDRVERTVEQPGVGVEDEHIAAALIRTDRDIGNQQPFLTGSRHAHAHEIAGQ